MFQLCGLNQLRLAHQKHLKAKCHKLMNFLLTAIEWKPFAGWVVVLTISTLWLAISMINSKTP